MGQRRRSHELAGQHEGWWPACFAKLNGPYRGVFFDVVFAIRGASPGGACFEPFRAGFAE